MNFPDGYFLEKSPAEIIAKVNTVTLANISLLSAEELLRIGWLGNPIIDKLYKIGSTGLWVAREQNAAGTSPLEAFLPILNTSVGQTLAVGDYDPFNIGQTAAQRLRRRVIAVPVAVVAGGAITDQELLPAVASYKYRVKVLGIACSITDAAVTILFEDSTPTTYVGCPASGFSLGFTADVLNSSLAGIVIYDATANKNLQVDISGAGAGAANFIFYLEYWLEA